MFSTAHHSVQPKPHTAADTLKTGVDSTPVGDIFFSQKNVDLLHEAIRYQVYKFSQCRHVIQRQSDKELQIIMRYCYMEFCKNMPFNVLSQVRDLNAIVLDMCVTQILREINMYVKYRSELMKNPAPFARPEFVSSAGTRSLEYGLPG